MSTAAKRLEAFAPAPAEADIRSNTNVIKKRPINIGLVECLGMVNLAI